jgi:transcriptional regulator with XRE-family HTH domain
MGVGERLKQERERLGMTIPELAAAAGVGKNTVIDWQNDVSSPPTTKLLALMIAGVDASFLLTGLRAKVHRRFGAIGEARNMLLQAGAPKAVGEAMLPALVELLSDAAPDLPEKELQLLEHYRRCMDEDKEQIQKLAARLAAPIIGKKGGRQ